MYGGMKYGKKSKPAKKVKKAMPKKKKKK